MARQHRMFFSSNPLHLGIERALAQCDQHVHDREDNMLHHRTRSSCAPTAPTAAAAHAHTTSAATTAHAPAAAAAPSTC